MSIKEIINALNDFRTDIIYSQPNNDIQAIKVVLEIIEKFENVKMIDLPCKVEDKQLIENIIIDELKCIQHLLQLYDPDCSSLSMYISDESIRANNPYWDINVKPIDVAYYNDERGMIHYDHSNQQI